MRYTDKVQCDKLMDLLLKCRWSSGEQNLKPQQNRTLQQEIEIKLKLELELELEPEPTRAQAPESKG